MELSARNVIKGTVKEIETGAVNSEVIIEIAPETEITSMITNKSCKKLGLEIGKTAYSVIKASTVMLGVE